MKNLPPNSEYGQNNQPSNPQGAGDPLTESQLIERMLMTFPFIEPHNPDVRDRMSKALSIVEVARDCAAHYLRHLRESPEQKEAHLKFGLEHSCYKQLIDPQTAGDRSTSLGYLRSEHGFTRYQTTSSLRKALIEAQIAIQKPTRIVTNVQTKETIEIGEWVLDTDLDRFVEHFREKEAAREHARYERRKGNRRKSTPGI